MCFSMITDSGLWAYSMVGVPLYDTLGPEACNHIINQGTTWHWTVCYVVWLLALDCLSCGVAVLALDCLSCGVAVLALDCLSCCVAVLALDCLSCGVAVGTGLSVLWCGCKHWTVCPVVWLSSEQCCVAGQ